MVSQFLCQLECGNKITKQTGYTSLLQRPLQLRLRQIAINFSKVVAKLVKRGGSAHI